MLHTQLGSWEEVDSQLLMVGSQTTSLIPNPSFAYNLGLQMSELPMQGHFRHLRFKTFPMTPITSQCEVFCPFLSSSEHSGVPEDFKSPTFPSVGLHPHTWPKWGCDIGARQHRHMVLLHQDSMAIVHLYGKPDLFITMTCNPKWEEIVSTLKPDEVANDRPDLVTRVFVGRL